MPLRMVFIEHNSVKSDIFVIPYLLHVFQGPGFSGSKFFRVRVQVLEEAFESNIFQQEEHLGHYLGIRDNNRD